MSNRHLAVQYGALTAVVTAMWSPFNVIGILPIALWAIAQRRMEGCPYATKPNRCSFASYPNCFISNTRDIK